MMGNRYGQLGVVERLMLLFAVELVVRELWVEAQISSFRLWRT